MNQQKAITNTKEASSTFEIVEPVELELEEADLAKVVAGASALSTIEYDVGLVITSSAIAIGGNVATVGLATS